MIGPMLACYVLLVLGMALAVCIACRRPDVLLTLGGLLTIATGALLAYLLLSVKAEPGDFGVVGVAVIAVAVLPFLGAGIILLIGGAVRRGRARRAPQGEPPGPSSSSESRSPSEGRGV